jgi:hypothetical protein
MKPTIFLSYCHKNEKEAYEIDTRLRKDFDVEIKIDIRDIKPLGDIKKFMESVRYTDFVIILVSKEYLESESCMYEVLELIKDNDGIVHFSDKTIPIILPSASSNGSNINTSHGRLHWIKYWADEYKVLDEKLLQFQKEDYHDLNKEEAIKELREQINRNKIIAELIDSQFFTLTIKNKLCIHYDKLEKKGYKQIQEKIFLAHNPILEEKLEEKLGKIDELDQERFKYISVTDIIDPKSFPFVSETYQIDMPGFTNVWLKDESTNPTGTHKDRMAWEVIRKFYHPLQKSNIATGNKEMPHLSIISSGSAAVAIQTLLKEENLPNLHVLTDENTDEKIVNFMEKIGCRVFKHNLREKALKGPEILQLTDNPMGRDLSSRKMLDPLTYIYYNLLSYNIINFRADYCFIPFGTGDLFDNVLTIQSREFFSDVHDPRLEPGGVKKTHFIGVTTYNAKSKCDKLFSHYLPFAPTKRSVIKAHKKNGICGEFTELLTITEDFVDKALEIADKLNINCEPSGIAGLGMLLQMADKIDKDAKILIVNTGKLKME